MSNLKKNGQQKNTGEIIGVNQKKSQLLTQVMRRSLGQLPPRAQVITRILGQLLTQVMRRSLGQLPPQVTRRILGQLLTQVTRRSLGPAWKRN